MPFVLNAAASGKGLHQGLIDATRFLIDWAAAMQTVARLHPGRHAAPGERLVPAHSFALAGVKSVSQSAVVTTVG